MASLVPRICALLFLTLVISGGAPAASVAGVLDQLSGPTAQLQVNLSSEAAPPPPTSVLSLSLSSSNQSGGSVQSSLLPALSPQSSPSSLPLPIEVSLDLPGEISLSLPAMSEASPPEGAEPTALLDLEIAADPSLGESEAPAASAPASEGEVIAAEALPSAPDERLLNGFEQNLFDLTNRERETRGLRSLAFDLDLLSVARTRAEDHSTRRDLNHYDALGRLAFAVLIEGLGLRYRLAGENLARVSGTEVTAPQRAMTALMASPTHRANILELTFNRYAPGMVWDQNGRVVFAQIFRTAS